MRRRVLALTAFCVVSLAVAIGILLGSALWIRSTNRADASEVNRLQTSSNGLNASLVDQETGARGFVLTGESTFLAPYRSGVRQADQLIDRLHSLYGPGTTGRLAVDAVRRSADTWRSEIAEPEIRSVQSGDRQAAVELEASGRGKRLFDAVRSALAQLDQRIQRDQENHLHHIDTTTTVVVVIAGVMAALWVLISVLFAGGYRRWGEQQRLESEAAQARVAADDREQRWISRFASLSERLNRTETLDAVAQIVAEEAARPVDGRYVHLGLLNDAGDLSMRYDREFSALESAPRLRRRDERTPLPDTVRTGRPIVIGEAPGAIPMSEVADFATLAESAGVVAITTTPLTQANGEIIGALAIMWDEPVALDSVLRSRLDEIAALVAESIRRASLFEAGLRLAGLSTSLSEALTSDQIGDVVTKEAAAVVGARVANLALVATNGETVQLFHRGQNDDGRTEVLSIPASIATPLTDVVADGRQLLMESPDAYRERNPGVVSEMERRGIESGVVLPLFVRNRVVGSVSFGWARPRDFSVADPTLTTLIELISAAVSRAATFRANTRVAEFAGVLASATTTDVIAGALFDIVVSDVLDAISSRVAVLRDTDGSVEVHHPPGTPEPIVEGFSRLALATDVPIVNAIRENRRVVISDADEIARRWPALGGSGAADRPAWLMAIPLRSGAGRPIGAISVIWRSDPSLDATTNALLDTVVEFCGATLERIHLYDLEHELVDHMARHLAPPPSISLPSIEAAGRYEPALSGIGMGGDWYDFIELERGAIGAVVGDVVGHGVTAIADMAELKASVATLIRTGTDVDHLFVTVASLLPPQPAFRGTALYAEIDAPARRLRVATAGHPPPLLWRAGRSTTVLTNGASYPALGIGVRELRSAAPVDFDEDALFFAYTDGLIERRGESIDEGIARAVALLDAVGDRSLDEIADAIQRELGRGAADDVAYLLVRNRAASN